MIALDTEGTGLDPEQNSILSIGALDTDNPLDQFYGECRVWTGALISDEALAINGFTQESATDLHKQTEAELIASFTKWLLDPTKHRDTTIVGQNSSFDRDFMKAACKRAGIAFPFGHRTIDIHSLVWMHMLEREIVPPKRSATVGNASVLQSGISLTVALAYCGLPPEEKPHNALKGAYAHAEVFSRIAYTKKMLAKYNAYDIPWTINKT